MSDKPEDKKLINPPTQTELVSKSEKKVKVKLNRDAHVEGRLVLASRDPKKPVVVEVTEERAQELCVNRKGNYSFTGERYEDATRHNNTVAQRV